MVSLTRLLVGSALTVGCVAAIGAGIDQMHKSRELSKRQEETRRTTTKTVEDTTFYARNDGPLHHYKAQYPNGRFFECTRDSAGAISYTGGSTIDSVPQRVAACNHIASLYK